MTHMPSFAQSRKCRRMPSLHPLSLSVLVSLLFAGIANDAFAEEPASGRFQTLLNEIWETRLVESPLFATSVGDSRFNAQLDRVTLADEERRNTEQAAFLQRLDELLPRLSGDDALNGRIMQRLLRQSLEEYGFRQHLIPITNREGFHVSFPELPKQMPLRTEKDYRDYVSRLSQFRRLAREHVDVMREGIAEGITLPSVVLEGYREILAPNVVDDPADSLLYVPFREFPTTVPESARGALVEAGATAIRESVVPGYREFLTFMSEEYVPAGRDAIAASALPNGREFYRYCVRKFTTTDMLPEEVHAVGLSEVARIREEMSGILRQVHFEGDLAQFIEYLRTDPRFYADSAEALLQQTAWTLKKMDGLLPRLFKTLPRTPYGIRVIPAYIAPRTTTAYYMPPRGDGSEAGFYYVNTFNLKSRPLYEIEALSLHEAVPGHHLQIALQQELVNLPDFRRFTGFTAFVEGWALYAERLGQEVGFYEDPYSDFGRLTYEMWRACRLVVDTGMHYLGWSREQAIAFMEENTALSKHNIRAEVDRYISWPGQALGYKIGELKIRELRQLAEETLGDRFDLREFHDVVLLAGAIPLDMLESRVREYIERRAGE